MTMTMIRKRIDDELMIFTRNEVLPGNMLKTIIVPHDLSSLPNVLPKANYSPIKSKFAPSNQPITEPKKLNKKLDPIIKDKQENL